MYGQCLSDILNRKKKHVSPRLSPINVSTSKFKNYTHKEWLMPSGGGGL